MWLPWACVLMVSYQGLGENRELTKARIDSRSRDRFHQWFMSSELKSGDFPWWRHQLETISALLAFCAGNSPVTGEFPAQRPVTRSFDVALICAWTDSWANNGDAGDLRRYRAHIDVNWMPSLILTITIQTDHHFAYIMTVRLLWHVPHCSVIGSLSVKAT